jgi:hypothetical protein
MRSPSGLSSCSWAQALYVSAGAKLLIDLHVPCQKTAKQVLSQLAHLMRDAGSTTVAPRLCAFEAPGRTQPQVVVLSHRGMAAFFQSSTRACCLDRFRLVIRLTS